MRTFTLTAILAATSLARACTLNVYSEVGYEGVEQTINGGPSGPPRTLSISKAASFKFSRGIFEKCCATFCAGNTQTGYRCSSASDDDVASKYRFNKVVVRSGNSDPAACD
jgi:hypothetical protein